MGWFSRKHGVNIESGKQGFQPRALKPAAPPTPTGFIAPPMGQGTDEKLDMILETFTGYQRLTSDTPVEDGSSAETDPRSVSERFVDGELPMFMTPKEILETHQPLDGDRLNDREHDPVEGDARLLKRKSGEAKQRFPNGRPYYVMDESAWTRDDWPVFPHAEELPNLPNLYDEIAEKGVEEPIELEVDLDDEGMMGKPEILGGHHRLAVQLEVDPDQPVPVAFFDDMRDVREFERQRRVTQHPDRYDEHGYPVEDCSDVPLRDYTHYDDEYY